MDRNVKIKTKHYMKAQVFALLREAYVDSLKRNVSQQMRNITHLTKDHYLGFLYIKLKTEA